MALVSAEFEDRLKFYANCWWPARSLVQSAIDNRFLVHESGAILKLERGGCPWKSHFFDLERDISGVANDTGSEGDSATSSFEIRFVLYADKDTWRVQCVPVSEKQGFQNRFVGGRGVAVRLTGVAFFRLGLLEAWRGVRDDQLSTLAGIPGCVFVHASGFIGGNKTYEGALEMAVRTLNGQ